MSDIKFKSTIKAQGGINLPNQTVNTVPVVDGSGNVVSSAVTSTELGQLSGVTTPIQTQLNDKISSAEKGAANGVAPLNSSAKIDALYLPSYVDDVLEFADLASLPVTGETGKIYVTLDTNKTYRWSGSAYIEVSPSEVTSVFGRSGAVVAQSGDYTATQITNTPAGDISATNVQAALNELDAEKQPLDATLTALAAYNTNGIVVQTAADTFTGRSIVGTAGNISVVNGDGVLNDPTIDLVDAGTAGTFGATDETLTITTDAKGRVTAVVSNAIAIVAAQVSDFFANVRNTVLSGFTETNAVVTNTDTVEQGIGKLQGQITALAANDVLGDISLTTFAGANNQTPPADVTAFAFNPAQVRSFKALVSVSVDATTDLYEAFELLAVYKNGSWDLAISSTGDDSLVTFTITNAGQMQYTSPSYAGFVSLNIEFRAIVTHI